MKMKQSRKQEHPGHAFDVWAKTLTGERMTKAEEDEAIAEQIRIAKEASDTELGRQIRLFRQEITGVREEMKEHRRVLANIMNQLKEDVSTRLLNFTSEYDFLTFKQEINERIDTIFKHIEDMQ